MSHRLRVFNCNVFLATTFIIKVICVIAKQSRLGAAITQIVVSDLAIFMCTCNVDKLRFLEFLLKRNDQ